MNQLVVLPVVLAFVTSVASLAAARAPRVQRVVAIGGFALAFLAAAALGAVVWSSGIQVVEVGSWPAPFGITLVADHLSSAMLAVSSLILLAGAVYAVETPEGRPLGRRHYPMLGVLAVGIYGAFVAGDLFNLYVWFEVILIASFVLLTMGGKRGQLRGGVKYVAINLVASALLLTSVGLVYGLTGTLNLAELSMRLQEVPSGASAAVALLFLVALGIKAGLFPLFGWLPDAYPNAPIAISAVFAGLLTKVGVYALVRVFTLLFAGGSTSPNGVLLVLATLTMLTGVLAAAAHRDVRRILSWHVVSQIGFMLMALAISTPLAMVGLVFYVVHHIVVKTNLFFVSGLAERFGGSFSLSELGSLYRERPWLAVLFLVPALSLAGLPPLSGFWAKLLVIKATLDAGHYAVAAAALVAGALTLYSMSKIWLEAYWKPRPVEVSRRQVRPGLTTVLPCATLAVVTLLIGVAPAAPYAYAERAAGELLDPSVYVTAVLGAPTP